jgi:signal transduction histidine kinase
VEDIFQPFHQLDGSSTRRYGGTGLGLSLVRQIVEAHQAKITVSSEVGKYARFSFLLPYLNPD